VPDSFPEMSQGDIETATIFTRAMRKIQSKFSALVSDISGKAAIAGGADANFTAMPQVGGDPIVESGSNADGEWTKWADGTQHVSVREILLEYDSGFSLRYEWTFPMAFFSVPMFVDWSGSEDSAAGFSGSARGKGEIICEAASTTDVSVRYVGPTGTFVSGEQIKATAVAIGRWK